MCVCVLGMVYNISPYMEFHPGGEEELMKAAGIDGTDLFDQVQSRVCVCVCMCVCVCVPVHTFWGMVSFLCCKNC